MKMLKTVHQYKTENDYKTAVEKIEKHKREMAKMEEKRLKKLKSVKKRICRSLSQMERKKAQMISSGGKSKFRK